ncbi:MAG TPA: hypothetical protein PKD91_01595, partial [Bacteroidia bacterium]|nr:hypothetical protein [Bacteroidia bacterium]
NLSDGDTVRVRMISDAQCASPATVFSNEIIARLIPYMTPAAFISMVPATPVCDGDNITFTSTTVNGGGAPTYQWYLNNNPTGAGLDSLTGIFSDGDSISVVMTSSYQCLNQPSDTSNILVAVVMPNLVPSVTITVNPQGPVCPGDLLTFNATSVNEGPAPTYQWSVNGNTVGGNNPFLFSSVLSDGDLVHVVLTSSETCVTTPNATSNNIQVQISQNIIPDVTIAVAPVGSVCDGDLLTFTATYTGGGP